MKQVEKTNKAESIKDLAFKAAELAEDKKGMDTEVLDVQDVMDVTDYVIITSGDSPAQLKAIAGHIEDSMSKEGVEPSHKEGRYGDKWFLLDYTDFIVHIIDSEAREFYNLEELWSKAFFVPRNEWLLEE